MFLLDQGSRLIFFLDLPSFEAHVTRIATAGVGPLIAGSMGEALHLSHAERVRLIHAARNALDKAGLPNVPLIVGTGAGSTRETIELTKEAAAAVIKEPLTTLFYVAWC